MRNHSYGKYPEEHCTPPGFRLLYFKGSMISPVSGSTSGSSSMRDAGGRFAAYAFAEMLPLVGFDPHCFKLFFRGFRRKPIQKIVVDELYDFSFLRLNDEMVAVPAITVNLKLAVRNTLLKPFAGTPLYIFRNAAAFLLGKGRKDGQHQFAVTVVRWDSAGR